MVKEGRRTAVRSFHLAHFGDTFLVLIRTGEGLGWARSLSQLKLT